MLLNIPPDLLKSLEEFSKVNDLNQEKIICVALENFLQDSENRRSKQSKKTAGLRVYKHGEDQISAEVVSRESEEIIRKIFSSVRDTILITRLDDGSIVECNNIVAGYLKDEIIGKTTSELNMWVDPEERVRMIHSIVKKGFIEDFEIRIRAKDGTIIPTSISVSKIKLGGIEHILTVGRDISERNKVEAKFTESESRLKSIIDSAPFGAHFYEMTDDGQLVFSGANPSANKIIGLDHSIFIGKTIEEAFPGLKETEVPDIYKRIALEDIVYDKDQINYDSEGITGAYEVHAFQTGYKRMAVFFHDITERKKYEEALKRSEEKYRQIVNTSNEGIWMFDENEKTIFVNSRMAEMIGYSEGEMFGIDLKDFLLEEDFPDHNNQMKMRRSGLSSHYERRLKRKDGKEIWTAISAVPCFDIQNNYTGSMGMFTDITSRKESEKELLLMELSLNSASDAFLWITPNAEFIYVNEMASRILGYGKNELLSMKVFDVDHAYNNEVWAEYWKTLKKNKSMVFESEYKRKDGMSIPVEIRFNFIEFHGEEYNFAIVSDITKRKVEEKFLQKYNMLLEKSETLAHFGSWEIDLNTKLVSASKGALHIYGIEKEKMTLAGIQAIPLPEYRPILNRAFMDLISGEAKYDVEFKIKRENDGEIRDIHSIAEYISVKNTIYGVFHDITEHKLTLEALKKSESKFRELFDHAPVGYHELDIEGRIIQINRTELCLLGYDEHEMLKHFIWEFIVEEEIAKETVKSKLKGDSPAGYTNERTFRRKDGRCIPVLIEDIILKNTEGVITGIRATIQDISEQKKNELALQDSNRRLEQTLLDLKETEKQVLQQERLRALGQMASGIAHDINNSLMPILGYSDLLLTNNNLEKSSEKQLRSIKTASQDIKRTIERMREFYRPKIEDSAFNVLDLNKIIKSTIELTKHRWKDIPESQGVVIKIFTQFTNDLPLIKGTESEVREALTNLVINACDAMPDGGKIVFKSMLVDKNLVVSVQDTGTGMDENTMLHCLDPFYSTKGEKGTGLGLSMVYGIMQRHKGKVEIESKLKIGTTINLIFPLEVIQSKNPKNITDISLPRLKILVIDDSANVRELLLTLLNDQHDVLVAESGKTGLQMFYDEYDRPKPFDVIITDLGMPYMDGKSVSESVKSKNPNMPIVLMTGWGSFIEEGSIKSVNYILKKPITIDELNKALEIVLKK
jgi:PAS domain S-box-containing protein